MDEFGALHVRAHSAINPQEVILVAGTIGEDATNPLAVTMTRPPALKFFSNSSGQTQISSVAGVLYAVSMYEQNEVVFYDIVGGGAGNSDIILEVKELSSDWHIIDVPFVNGLRLDNRGPKRMVVHYFET